MSKEDPDNGQDWVEDARNEVSGMLKGGMEHPSTKPVLVGAAVGAVGALALGLAWPAGLALGGGFMLYQRIKR